MDIAAADAATCRIVYNDMQIFFIVALHLSYIMTCGDVCNT